MNKWMLGLVLSAVVWQVGIVGAQTASDGTAEVTTETAIMDTLKQRFAARFPDYTVGDVRPTPLTGVYEIAVQGEVLYSDAGGRYIFQGTLIDLDTRTDLTAQRMQVLSTVAFETLPLHAAVTQVRGTGQRKIAIFEDPNCGYCKQFHRTLEGFDDITIHSLLLPVLAPDSREKSAAILCAPDQVAALRGWMLQGQRPPASTREAANCATAIDDVLAFGKQHNIHGTPAIYFADGSRANGALNAAQLTERLAMQGE